MVRQNISLTKPKDEWLKEQIEKEDFVSKSELLNNSIRKAVDEKKENEWIRSQLKKAEEKLGETCFVKISSGELLAEFKERAQRDGKL